MMSKSKVRSMAGMRDNSTTMAYYSMGRYIRGGGSSSKAKESGINKSLHFCFISYICLSNNWNMVDNWTC